MEVHISIEGSSPILLHSPRTANPLDPVTREMKRLTSKRNKTEEDYVEIARLEFQAGLYWEGSPEAGAVMMPTWNVAKSFIEGARLSKRGKLVERGLSMAGDQVPLLYANSQPSLVSMDDLWQKGYHDTMICRVGMQRISRTRPLFKQWACEVDAIIDPGTLDLDVLQDVATTAGRMIGLGTYRQRYGRYSVRVAQDGARLG